MGKEQIKKDHVDILEDQIPQELLTILLQDHTTGNNILWGTDIEHDEKAEIRIDDIIGENGLTLRPRVRKSEEEKRLRTKKRAEVFTPSWVCNEQLNAADMLWFHGEAYPVSGSPFNKVDGKNWKSSSLSALKKSFEKTKTDWKQYVLEDRIEMCCGEGPYLTSRYDVVTEREIPVSERIGILDRKLRVVNAFVGLKSGASKPEWMSWIKAAYQHTYGFEWQGDNLLLTREAMLYTFLDNLNEYNQMVVEGKKDPSKDSIWDVDFNVFNEADLNSINEIANIISWNCWQMDGLTGCTPYVSPSVDFKKLVNKISKSSDNNLFNFESFVVPKEFCRIMDWEENKVTTYADVYAEAIKSKSI